MKLCWDTPSDLPLQQQVFWQLRLANGRQSLHLRERVVIHFGDGIVFEVLLQKAEDEAGALWIETRLSTSDR